MTARPPARAARPPRAAALAVGLLPLFLACQGRPGGGGEGSIPGLSSLARPGETVLFARRFPVGTAAAGGAPLALVAVVRMADGHEELRVGEPRDGGFAVAQTSRPGDEFRNLSIEDVNADDRPEIVSRWTGGQLEAIEVLGRSPGGGWRPLLQNAGQVVEQHRRPDRTVAFWITSRTYEEEAGLPPIYETRVWRWDGTAFTEEAR